MGRGGSSTELCVQGNTKSTFHKLDWNDKRERVEQEIGIIPRRIFGEHKFLNGRLRREQLPVIVAVVSQAGVESGSPHVTLDFTLPSMHHGQDSRC